LSEGDEFDMDHPNAYPSSSHGHDESGRVIRVGSDPSNDIVIKLPTVYPFHVTFTLVANGCLIQDLTKAEDRDSQTFLACAENPTERTRITKPYWANYNDIVYLGEYPLPLARLLKKVPDDKKLGHDIIDGTVASKSEKIQPSQVISVGSDPSNRIVINAVTVAPRHAEFILEADDCIIRNCDDKAETFLVKVDDPSRPRQIIAGQLKASYDDTVLLGTYPFHFCDCGKSKI
jgi:hypothetical protein